MKNTPGPRAPPDKRRPRRKITALSYSWRNLYDDEDNDNEDEDDDEDEYTNLQASAASKAVSLSLMFGRR